MFLRARAVEEGYEVDEVDPAAAYSVIYGHTRPQRTNGQVRLQCTDGMG
jgi:hypothetical protein